MLFNVCWGPIQLRTIIYICKSQWCDGLCIVLDAGGGLLLGSETYPAKASLSDHEVSMSTCNIMQRIVCYIFLPLFPYCFLHIIISVFGKVQAWRIMQRSHGLDTSGNIYLVSVGYWLKSMTLPQFTAAKCLVFLGSTWEMAPLLLHILTLWNLQGRPKLPHGLPPSQRWTDLGKL